MMMSQGEGVDSRRGQPVPLAGSWRSLLPTSARCRVGGRRVEAVGVRGVLKAESKAPTGREGG